MEHDTDTTSSDAKARLAQFSFSEFGCSFLKNHEKPST